jgi:hypothetical protein
MYAFSRDGMIPGSRSTTYPIIEIPIALRVIYVDRFVLGPFHLGKFSYPVAITAVLWIPFIVFFLPELNSVNSQSLKHMLVASGSSLPTSLGSGS